MFRPWATISTGVSFRLMAGVVPLAVRGARRAVEMAVEHARERARSEEAECVGRLAGAGLWLPRGGGQQWKKSVRRPRPP